MALNNPRRDTDDVRCMARFVLWRRSVSMVEVSCVEMLGQWCARHGM